MEGEALCAGLSWGDAALKRAADGWGPALRRVDLRRNNITGKGLAYLAAALSHLSVEELLLSENPISVGDAGVCALADWCRGRRLRCLELRGCHLRDPHGLALLESFKIGGPPDVLDLSGNALSAGVLKKFMELPGCQFVCDAAPHNCKGSIIAADGESTHRVAGTACGHVNITPQALRTTRVAMTKLLSRLENSEGKVSDMQNELKQERALAAKKLQGMKKQMAGLLGTLRSHHVAAARSSAALKAAVMRRTKETAALCAHHARSMRAVGATMSELGGRWATVRAAAQRQATAFAAAERARVAMISKHSQDLSHEKMARETAEERAHGAGAALNRARTDLQTAAATHDEQKRAMDAAADRLARARSAVAAMDAERARAAATARAETARTAEAQEEARAAREALQVAENERRELADALREAQSALAAATRQLNHARAAGRVKINNLAAQVKTSLDDVFFNAQNGV